MKYLCLLFIALFMIGCATVRYTTETYMPGNPPDIAIEWPIGTTVGDLYTTVVDGQVITVCPLKSETSY